MMKYITLVALFALTSAQSLPSVDYYACMQTGWLDDGVDVTKQVTAVLQHACASLIQVCSCESFDKQKPLSAVVTQLANKQ